MTSNNEIMYWMKNKEWWFVNEKGQTELTDKAPQKARETFEKWLKEF